MKQDSTREKIWRRTLLQKSVSFYTEKENILMDVFINLQLTESGHLIWPFSGNFIKDQLKTIVTADRLDQERYWLM